MIATSHQGDHGLAKGLKSTSYVVAEHDNHAAMAILGGMIPSGAKTENPGAVAANEAGIGAGGLYRGVTAGGAEDRRRPRA
jgi:hypothetical protein